MRVFGTPIPGHGPRGVRDYPGATAGLLEAIAVMMLSGGAGATAGAASQVAGLGGDPDGAPEATPALAGPGAAPEPDHAPAGHSRPCRPQRGSSGCWRLSPAEDAPRNPAGIGARRRSWCGAAWLSLRQGCLGRGGGLRGNDLGGMGGPPPPPPPGVYAQRRKGKMRKKLESFEPCENFFGTT